MYNKELITTLLKENSDLTNAELARLYNKVTKEDNDVEQVRKSISRYRILSNSSNLSEIDKKEIKYNFSDEETKHVDNEKGTLKSVVDTTFDPKNDEELAKLHRIDLSKYKIVSYWSKLKSNGKFTSSVFCALIKFNKNGLTEEEVKESFIDEIKRYAPDYSDFKKHVTSVKKTCMYEISIPDLHIGKLSWDEEAGENYETKEAISRFDTAVDVLLSRINLDKVEKFLLPVGNDMINIDNVNMTTTAGTPQNCDSRWQQMFRKAKELIIKNIDKLSKIAPVDVVFVSGNHDFSTIQYLSEVIDAWYRTAKNVNVINNPSQRKYVEYGANLIGFTHGNEEKHQDLGLIMATEQKEAWARTKYREVHLGHYHKTKTIKYVDIDEFQGFKVRILPSLSATDAWHKSKGYMSTKAAEGFLYDKNEGMILNTRFNM